MPFSFGISFFQLYPVLNKVHTDLFHFSVTFLRLCSFVIIFFLKKNLCKLLNCCSIPVESSIYDPQLLMV